MQQIALIQEEDNVHMREQLVRDDRAPEQQRVLEPIDPRILHGGDDGLAELKAARARRDREGRRAAAHLCQHLVESGDRREEDDRVHCASAAERGRSTSARGRLR